jgi:ABC-2 type transport system ATP-binding protein
MLRLIKLTKKYGNLTAVNGINLDIEDGEFFGLLGPNGAGKTTTIRMISTLTSITSGDIIINHKSVGRNLVSVKRKIGIVPQQNNLENEMTAWENLQVHAISITSPRLQENKGLRNCWNLPGSKSGKTTW